MPKSALFMLNWSEERCLYELYEQDHLLLQADSESWFTKRSCLHPKGKEEKRQQAC